MKLFGNRSMYHDYLVYDERLNAAFRGTQNMTWRQKKEYEWKAVKLYRKFQSCNGTLMGRYYKLKLRSLEKKTGIHFEGNPNIGKGLIIGHWGRIVFNGNVKFGDNLFITHGITIGRDIRGKRKGVPTIGNNVCIRANSTVVGNIIIGNDVLIAPNTFVNFDVPDHSIVIGNPAKIIHRENATEGHIPNID
ncbi:MAG: serine acetyltransferase [Lachnospiraceae bacterium]|nr:serine acetyltransferase [Lachnospiraceae bacterium]